MVNGNGTKEDVQVAEKVATSIEEYKKVLGERRLAYGKHLTTMHVDPALKAWAKRMGGKKATVKVWHQELPWLEALMVVRYGEAVESWPAMTTIGDWGRALDWEAGKDLPAAVTGAGTLNLEGV